MENLEFSHRPSSQEKLKSWQIFDQIAPTYDITNRVLSFRQDVAWRKLVAKHLPKRESIELLDLATGTGDQIFHMLSVTNRISNATGIDLSEGMLAFGQKKIQALGMSGRVKLLKADATMLPFEENSFDAATMSFGIRNVPDVPKCLREISRVLRPEGRALILEFSLPSQKTFRDLYLYYFRKILPQIGGWISGHSDAYKYLNNTVEDFPYGEAFVNLMKSNGFKTVRTIPLTFGIANLYIGEKT